MRWRFLIKFPAGRICTYFCGAGAERAKNYCVCVYTHYHVWAHAGVVQLPATAQWTERASSRRTPLKSYYSFRCMNARRRRRLTESETKSRLKLQATPASGTGSRALSVFAFYAFILCYTPRKAGFLFEFGLLDASLSLTHNTLWVLLHHRECVLFALMNV